MILRGNLSKLPETPALRWERSKPGGHVNSHSTCVNPWKPSGSSRSSQPPAWSKPCGACVPACVPLPRCCLGDPPAGEVNENQFTLCVASVALCLFQCPVYPDTLTLLFLFVACSGGQVQDVRLWIKGVKRTIATPKTELMSNMQR